MIKGVNRQVVEIQDTGSEMFERILVILRPEYGDVSKDLLDRETKRVMNNLLPTGKKAKQKRRKRKTSLPFFLFNTVGQLRR